MAAATMPAATVASATTVATSHPVRRATTHETTPLTATAAPRAGSVARCCQRSRTAPAPMPISMARGGAMPAT